MDASGGDVVKRLIRMWRDGHRHDVVAELVDATRALLLVELADRLDAGERADLLDALRAQVDRERRAAPSGGAYWRDW
jgi:hypothetical protein